MEFIFKVREIDKRENVLNVCSCPTSLKMPFYILIIPYILSSFFPKQKPPSLEAMVQARDLLSSNPTHTSAPNQEVSSVWEPMHVGHTFGWSGLWQAVTAATPPTPSIIFYSVLLGDTPESCVQSWFLHHPISLTSLSKFPFYFNWTEWILLSASKSTVTMQTSKYTH